MGTKLRRDADGVPVVDGMEIEKLAERFLASLVPSVLRAATFTPLAEIVTILRDRGLIKVDFCTDLGYSRKGYKYLGCYLREKQTIYIDRALEDTDPRFPFTVAHELGHFYLHSRLSSTALGGEASPEIRDTSRDLVVHRVESTSPRSLIEWQANRFAAALLVPQATLHGAVIAEQRQMGITRRLGMVWVDSQPSSRRDYRDIIIRIANLYKCSRAVVRYRLAELGISREFSRTGWPTRVGDLLGDALEDLFPPEHPAV